MKLYSLCIPFLLFLSSNVLAQKAIRHKVKPGESIYAIGKKYDVSVSEIYDLNPKLKGSILGLETEVKIPNKNYKPSAKKANPQKKEVIVTESSSIHLVERKETIYSISKKYGISMEALCEVNPELKTGNLKSGMRLKLSNSNAEIIPIKAEGKKEERKSITEESKVVEPVISSDLIHKVQPKETLFRISEKYDISINELQKLNPSVASGLPVGYDLVIRKRTGEKGAASPTTTEEIKKVFEVKPLSFENISKAEFLISKASENIGTRYRSGGTTTAGFDCSGLMFCTFKNIDMTLPRSSHDMAQYGTRIDRSQAQKGDLIFFATFGKGRVSHVGMITEVLDGEIKFIHSSTQSGVIVSSTKENYYTKTFVQINRVLQP